MRDAGRTTEVRPRRHEHPRAYPCRSGTAEGIPHGSRHRFRRDRPGAGAEREGGGIRTLIATDATPARIRTGFSKGRSSRAPGCTGPGHGDDQGTCSVRCGFLGAPVGEALNVSCAEPGPPSPLRGARGRTEYGIVVRVLSLEVSVARYAHPASRWAGGRGGGGARPVNSRRDHPHVPGEQAVGIPANVSSHVRMNVPTAWRTES